MLKKWNGKEKVDVGVVGIPFDYGVYLSGGRVGAAEAPSAIRHQLKKYGSGQDIETGADFSTIKMVDFRNPAVVSVDCVRTHLNTAKLTETALHNSEVVITLGGGHDNSYATITALAQECDGDIGGINVDAHFDARSVVNGNITSGTPFRRLIDGDYLKGKNFCEFGIQGHVNLKEHYEWLEEKGVSVHFLPEVRALGVEYLFDRTVEEKLKDVEAMFVSIDIDSVAQAFAPGSSAPSPDGLFPEDVLQIAYLAGKNPKVKLFEIMEVNPRYDVDNRTSRLAANIILKFLSGYCQRK